MKDFKGYVYPPARATKVAVDEFERRSKHNNPIEWGIPMMDDRIIPAIPGDLITTIGRPGMGKTLAQIYLAKLAARKNQENDVVVYATWETMVEEFVGILSASDSGYSLEDISRGRADMTKIKNALVKVLGNGIIVFGQSMENRNNFDTPNLLQLDETLAYLKENGYNIRALLIDYAQAIPGLKGHFSASESSKMTTVSDNVFFAKALGKKHGCPVFLAVQARRDVDQYAGLKFPTLNDSQWSSVTEQASDKVFGITMPSKYMKPGVDQIKLKGFVYTVHEMTFGIKMLKQRFGPVSSSDVWLLTLDPVRLEIEEHATDGEDFDDGDMI